MKILIIADSPSSDIKLEYQKDSDITICLDGAAEKILSTMRVDYILGDFDTIERNKVDINRLNAKHIKLTDQNSTDLEKGIEYAISLGAKSICIANAFGGRVDHSLYNISLLKKYHDQVDMIYMTNQFERIHYFSNESINFAGKAGANIAIMPFSAASISSEGLQYDMNEFDIEIGQSASVSNALNKENGYIKIVGDVLITSDYSVVISAA